MNFEQLHYFKHIYEQLSLNAVAKQMYISQPALTKSLKNMERELGVALFVRSKKDSLQRTLENYFIKSTVQILELYKDTLMQINSNIIFSGTIDNLCAAMYCKHTSHLL